MPRICVGAPSLEDSPHLLSLTLSSSRHRATKTLSPPIRCYKCRVFACLDCALRFRRFIGRCWLAQSVAALLSHHASARLRSYYCDRPSSSAERLPWRDFYSDSQLECREPCHLYLRLDSNEVPRNMSSPSRTGFK